MADKGQGLDINNISGVADSSYIIAVEVVRDVAVWPMVAIPYDDGTSVSLTCKKYPLISEQISDSTGHRACFPIGIKNGP